MNSENIASKQKWVIAIVLLNNRKPACHTLETYAYPVIQQGRESVGIAFNLPPSLFFGVFFSRQNSKLFGSIPILQIDCQQVKSRNKAVRLQDLIS
jgi:hypothetical protein